MISTMSSFPPQFSSKSPVLALSPQNSHPPSIKMPAFSSTPFNFGHQSNCSEVQQPPERTARKRSRDEAAINLEPDRLTPEPVESQNDWIYGEGMTLIKPSTGYVADASSQSGTWKEEKEARTTELRLQNQLDQQDVRSHKSQRTDCKQSNMSLPPEVLGRPLPGMPVISPMASPIIDDFTLHLGIGWNRISEDEHIQAAARGWSRFIENHYPLTKVTIRLESKGLQSYLAETDQGYFLFAEDLRQARLVSQDVETAMRNLQRTPPIFDGANAILPCETSAPIASLDMDVRMD